MARRKLTGKTARTWRKPYEWLQSQEQQRADGERLQREAEAINDENDLIRKCVALEGEPKFYRWWDDDRQVPKYWSRRERIDLLKKRLEKLETDADHSNMVQPNDETV